ncbi:hypothetical protein Q5752_001639 [Cryptotrichosporon argae]
MATFTASTPIRITAEPGGAPIQLRSASAASVGDHAIRRRASYADSTDHVGSPTPAFHIHVDRDARGDSENEAAQPLNAAQDDDHLLPRAIDNMTEHVPSPAAHKNAHHKASSNPARYEPSVKPQTMVAAKGNDTLVLSELHYWTNDSHIVDAAKEIGVRISHKDVSFAEHRCNGKSKGHATVRILNEFHLAALYERFLEHEFHGKKVKVEITSSRIPTRPGQHGTADRDGRHRFDDEYLGRAPLPFLPTNSHGGVNFNRVPMHHRQQMQQMQQAGFLRREHPHQLNARSDPSALTLPMFRAGRPTNYVSDAVHKSIIGPC